MYKYTCLKSGIDLIDDCPCEYVTLFMLLIITASDYRSVFSSCRCSCQRPCSWRTPTVPLSLAVIAEVTLPPPCSDLYALPGRRGHALGQPEEGRPAPRLWVLLAHLCLPEKKGTCVRAALGCAGAGGTGGGHIKLHILCLSLFVSPAFHGRSVYRLLGVASSA